MKKDNYFFSCILENKPMLVAQSYIWIISLLELGNINSKNIFVHLIGDFDIKYLQYLERTGVNIIQTEPFDQYNRYCNKLGQFNTFRNRKDFDYVFLMDCDTATVSLEGLDLTELVYAKIVDFPSPPIEILESIYKAKRLKFKYVDTSLLLDGENKTVSNNANGGLYIISKQFFNELTIKWEKYALWSLQNTDLYTETFQKHVDQVSFSMALNDFGIEMTELDISWNFPTHVDEIVPNIKPNIIHFHDKIDQHFKLQKIGLENVDAVIDEINTTISENLSGYLDNKLFWDFRYYKYPELGSGVGSRGDVLENKKKLLKYLSYSYYGQAVIDVGCGDLELTKDLPYNNYLGLDVSEKAIEICKSKKPEWQFLNTIIEDNRVPDSEMIICFDVLIHQSTKKEFTKTLNAIIQKSRKRVVIGAYNSNPIYSSSITHYYEPIEDLVRSSGKFDEVSNVYEYRDVSVIVGTTKGDHHDRDISSEDLNRAYKEVNRPDLLQYIVDISRYHFGFYTSHYPRVFEYTWLLQKALENENIKTAIDIGAGVCPIPIALSEEGINVITVDGHTCKRDFNDKSNWNEWGFLDYAKVRSNIKSYHQNFEDFKQSLKVDMIYSISVIEHMPQKKRLKILRKASGLLKKKGLLLLTVDLVPDTDKMWNLSEGKIVEDERKHGTVNSFLEEIKKAGFEVLESDILRSIKDSRTDILFIKAQKKKGLNIFNV